MEKNFWKHFYIYIPYRISVTEIGLLKTIRSEYVSAEVSKHLAKNKLILYKKQVRWPGQLQAVHPNTGPKYDNAADDVYSNL